MIIGTKFSFDIEPDERSGKSKASNVTVLERGSGPAPSGKGGGGGGGKGHPTGPGGQEKCGDFLAGRCTRGDRCKYSHDDGRGGPVMGGGQPDPRSSPYGGGAMPAYGGPMPGYGAPMPAYGAPGLPPGWEQVTDPASGRPYFCNRATGQTSWEPPAAAPMPVYAAPPPAYGGAPQLPPGWETVPDPATGKMYYCNRATGQSSWEVPR